MKNYIWKRILFCLISLWAITFFCFCLLEFMPSDPAEVVLRQTHMGIISEELLAQQREIMGLNRPFLTRYLDWLKACIQLDLGTSYMNPSKTVWGELTRCFPYTFQLTVLSCVWILVFSIPLGFLCGVYENSWYDKCVRGFIFFITAVPSYWLGLFLIWLVSIKWDLLPTSGMSEGVLSLILPSITVASSHVAVFIRLIRTNMLEQMKEGYVFYAHARGLRKRDIWIKHILKNSMHTYITAFGMSIPQFISGTIVVENVFAISGLGTLCIEAVLNRDFPIIQGYILCMGVLFMSCNFFFDLWNVLWNPKWKKDD